MSRSATASVPPRVAAPALQSRLSMRLPSALLCGLLAACSSVSPPRPTTGSARPIHAVTVPDIERPSGETPQWWYRSGAARAAGNGAMKGKAKNIILFLGDGMSLTTVAAARILAGQREGRPGEETQLSWERFPHTALSRTYNTDSQTPDSAGTMTAIATGVKSHMGAIGVSAGDRDDCAGSQQRQLQSWLRLASDAGLSTGIVTTARLTHATPAAVYAHVPNRNWENDTDLPAEARAQGCRDIAQQLLDFEPGKGPSIVLGGGRGEFLPATERDPEHDDKVGQRLDGRDLSAEWRQAHPDGHVVWNSRQFRSLPANGPILGLFEYDHMQYEHDRNRGDDGEPDLAEMTRTAIERLSRDGNGFVLLVESGRIDHANHEGNAFRALDETVAMSRAVQAAVDATSADETLIIVTADHSHTLNLVGYPVRGNPILGKVRGVSSEDAPMGKYALDATGLPYTTLSYANGPGYTGASNQQPAGPKTHFHKPSRFDPATGRPDLSAVDTEHPDYMQEALVPMASESHGGDDVGVWAIGPGSDAMRGSIEQNVIYHVIVQATPRLRRQLCARRLCNADGVPVELPAMAPAAPPAVAPSVQ